MRIIALIAAVISLSACVTARLHSEAELADVGRQCGRARGELFQAESEKKLLVRFKVQPTPAERSCVYQFARRNKLRMVLIDAINDPAS